MTPKDDLERADELIKQMLANVQPLYTDVPMALAAIREHCLSLDPHRGVSCNEPLGHDGDHKSIGGFAWENDRFPRPRYEGASPEDMAALEEILAVPVVEPYVKTVAHHAFTTLSGGMTCNWRTRPWRKGEEEPICGLPREHSIHEDRCDDCGMRYPAHDLSVEH
jgi:hypothetical protein